MAPDSSPEKDGAQDIDAPALESMFTKELSTAFAALGCFNLAIFGATGAGKSTLVNAVFGRDVADTGVGEPVTRGVDYHRRDDGFLGIFDSEGFETGSAGDQILKAFAMSSKHSEPLRLISKSMPRGTWCVGLIDASRTRKQPSSDASPSWGSR